LLTAFMSVLPDGSDGPSCAFIADVLNDVKRYLHH
jgi:hypothetical protein